VEAQSVSAAGAVTFLTATTGGESTEAAVHTPCTWTGEPIALRIREAVRISGLSRSAIYRFAASGKIILLKCGSSTLVEYTSLRDTMASLPRACIRARDGP
jgi:hypothetical protein